MEFLPLIAAGWAVAVGLASRFGPGRAVSTALRSRFTFKPNPESVRSAEIQMLRRMITEKNFCQSYLVVTGDKGFGKTGESAKQVVFWHRLFTLGRSAIVVTNASERQVGQDNACLGTAARISAEVYKLRVVVVGTPNTLEDRLFRTKRQRVIEIEPLTKGMVCQIRQLQDLLKYVKHANLEDTVFAVLGGIPSFYKQLWTYLKIDLQSGLDAREVIGTHLCATIYHAMRLVKESLGSETAKLVKLFQEIRAFTESTLVTNELQLGAVGEVFNEAERDGRAVLVPVSENCSTTPSYQGTHFG